MAREGLDRIKKELKADTKVVTNVKSSDFYNQISNFAEDGYDVIICHGGEFEKAARRRPSGTEDADHRRRVPGGRAGGDGGGVHDARRVRARRPGRGAGEQDAQGGVRRGDEGRPAGGVLRRPGRGGEGRRRGDRGAARALDELAGTRPILARESTGERAWPPGRT